MLATMTPQQLIEWEAYYRVEMPDRTDFYWQQMLSLFHRASFAKSKAKPGDFAPDLRTDEQRQAASLARLRLQQEEKRLTEWGAKVLEEKRSPPR